MKAQMKRALALLVALLLCSVALAEDDVYRYVVSQGYTPASSQIETDQANCVFKTGASKSTVVWTSDGMQYRVTESTFLGKLQDLYLDLLSQKDWDSAQYIAANGTALFGYHSDGEAAREEASTFEEYAQKVSAYLHNEDQQDYVLNKNTKRFHLPTCGNISQIKDTNREDVHENRQKLIDDGYRPCGHCKP